MFRFMVPLALAASGSVLAQDAGSPGASTSAPFEIVESHSDIDVNDDGSYVEANETGFRVLDSRGQKALQQTTLSYTEGLQTLEVGSAYTLKANGQKIPVSPDQILRGSGATSAPGFEDIQTVTIVFPRLEIGDEVVLTTLKKQLVPLFAGEFAMREDFSRAVKTNDVRITLTAPKNGIPLRIDAVGLDGGQPAEYAGKNRWVWYYHNDSPVIFPLDSVMAAADQPHLIASSFPSYQTVGAAYGDHFVGKADATPEIESLADQLTRGISDRRGQTKALYDWVAANINYLDIVLGAGGFTPHAAADVLALRYGDCKDHVMLLEALLGAKGIPSEPVLIGAGGGYVLPDVPSPFYFNHLITYVPEFRLFLDSTAHYAPFGVLPLADADRPVLLLPSGTVSATPRSTADDSTGHAAITVKFDPDGTETGESQISLTGAGAVDQRAVIDSIPPEREKEMFQLTLGPGSEASIDRGNLRAVSDPFVYALHYRVPNAANFTGPGAISTGLGVGPFAVASLALGLLPPSRPAAYGCPSVTTSEDSTFEFPANVQVTSVPKPVGITADGIHLELHYDIKDPHTVAGRIMLRTDHARAFCTPDYYAKVRPDLSRIVGSLRGQVLYK
jgi:transglutaminase-like putative cysteine protease